MTLKMIEKGETHVTFARDFAAAPQALYEAHTDPEIIQRWMTGPEGSAMPVCRVEARPGGSFHYEYAAPGGYAFTIEGDFVSLQRPHRIVHIERMHLPQPDGQMMITPDNRVETSFTATSTGSRMVMRMQVPDSGALEAMLASGMEGGMEASFARLEALAAA